MPAVRDARAAWALLAVALLLVAQPLTAPFLLAAAAAWIPGATVLSGARAGAAIARLADVLRAGPGRRSLMCLGLVGVGVLVALGPLAALALATLLAGLLLVMAAYRDQHGVEQVLTGLAIMLVTVTLGLLAAEALLRIPSVAGRFGSPQQRAQVDAGYDSLWTRNAFGLRTRHETVRKPPGTSRVLALGDSFTWGDKIMSADDVWPARLEVALRAASHDSVQVVNMGQRGWTTANEAEFLRRVGWQFDPDVVVLQYFVNDPYESGPNYARDGEQWETFLPARFRNHGVQKSSLLYVLELAYNVLRKGSQQGNGKERLYDRSYRGWQQYEASIREIGDSSRSQGIPVVFLLYPEFVPGNWSVESYPLRAYYEQAAEVAAASGLIVLDLTSLFAARGGDWRRWWVLPWDSHPSLAAHALTADTLAAFITARRFLDSTAARGR